MELRQRAAGCLQTAQTLCNNLRAQTETTAQAHARVCTFGDLHVTLTPNCLSMPGCSEPLVQLSSAGRK